MNGGTTLKVNLAIVYYSSTGTNYQLAQWAAEGGTAAGAEVKIYKVQELAPQAVIDNNPAWKAHLDDTKSVPIVTPADIVQADAIVFCTPTRFGNVAAQMKQFLDTTGGIWFQGKTVNKVVSAMTSAQNPHGGQEMTILSLYTTMYHWGAIVVAPGYTDQSLYKAGGNPYGTSVSVDQDGKMKEDVKEAAMHQAKRVVEVAGWLKKGMELKQ
ncbi:MAG: NAD(P)H:quinone oxidoreductase [Peptococcaceae bacterium]|nr:NAD(P)H:quinone oxidoreductase [Peptococcaceae bacterium]